MKSELTRIQKDSLAAIAKAGDDKELEQVRIQFLGKKGKLPMVAARMRDLSAEEKPEAGKLLNAARQTISDALDSRVAVLKDETDRSAIRGIDGTLPARSLHRGGLHPLSIVKDQAIRILQQMGFSLASGPEIETEFHCFDALNTPPDHPARNPKDTFYFGDGKLLRTHTSSVQIRTMERASPPVRIIAPGSAYRRDEVDATHLSVFNQLEGLYVAQNDGSSAGVTLLDLKGTLELFLHALFGKDTEVRFRPHYFPFTEPSFEIDVRLVVKGEEPKWIEVAGCGLVDPTVFEAVTESRNDQVFHPDQVSGFAFGLGLDRLAMIKWGIKDIRLLIENDVRFLRQFA